MTTLDKFMIVFATVLVTLLTIIVLVGMYYNHVEKMADKNIELVKLEKMCIDE